MPSIPWSNVSVFVMERIAIIHSLKYTVQFLLVIPLFVTRCHSFSFGVTRFTTRCHSLYHSLSFVITRHCTTRCFSFSFVVTRCTSRLSFYKRFLYLCKCNRILVGRGGKIKKRNKEIWLSLLWQSTKF